MVLAEKQQCPFTNQPLALEQIKLLTKTNIHLYRAHIVNGGGGGGGGGAGAGPGAAAQQPGAA